MAVEVIFSFMIEHVEHEKLRVEAGQNQRQDHIACLLVTMAEKSKAESYSDAWNLDITKSHTTQQKKRLLRLQGVLLVPPSFLHLWVQWHRWTGVTYITLSCVCPQAEDASASYAVGQDRVLFLHKISILTGRNLEHQRPISSCSSWAVSVHHLLFLKGQRPNKFRQSPFPAAYHSTNLLATFGPLEMAADYSKEKSRPGGDSWRKMMLPTSKTPKPGSPSIVPTFLF